MRDGKSSRHWVESPGVKKIHWESHWAEASPPDHSTDRSLYLSDLNPSISMTASQYITTNEDITEEGDMGTIFEPCELQQHLESCLWLHCMHSLTSVLF